MNPYPNLLSDSPNISSVEKTTPFPATNSCYRSRLYSSNININPLIASCDQLFNLVTTLKTTEYPEDSERFLQDLAHEIRAFEHRAYLENYPDNTIIAARYALCCLLDETIAQTPWGQKNNWFEKNLLSLFYQENYGGERFFSIITRSLENIASHLHLLELLYLCLNFGFTGKYRNNPQDQNELIALTNKLYQIIGQHSLTDHKNILVQEKKSTFEKAQATSNSQLKTPIDTKKLFMITTATAIVISGFIYLGINFKLSRLTQPVYSSIMQITDPASANNLLTPQEKSMLNRSTEQKTAEYSSNDWLLNKSENQT